MQIIFVHDARLKYLNKGKCYWIPPKTTTQSSQLACIWLLQRECNHSQTFTHSWTLKLWNTHTKQCVCVCAHAWCVVFCCFVCACACLTKKMCVCACIMWCVYALCVVVRACVCVWASACTCVHACFLQGGVCGCIYHELCAHVCVCVCVCVCVSDEQIISAWLNASVALVHSSCKCC